MGRWRITSALTTRAVPYGFRRRLKTSRVVSPLVARRSSTTSRADGLTLTGTANGNPIFVIVLNPVNATYTVDMIGTVDVTTEINFSGGGFDFAGGNTEWNGFIPSTSRLIASVFINNESPDILLTPEIGGERGARWSNPDQCQRGRRRRRREAGGANVVAARGETFRVDFVTDLAGEPA